MWSFGFSRRNKLEIYKNKVSANYVFRKSKDGYLIYRRRYTQCVRKLLVFVYKVIKLIIEKREENRKINERILKELEAPFNIPINKLDAFYKKEFRKKKYMYSFKNRTVRSLPEPKKKYFDFLPDQSKIKAKVSPIEFFKSFGEKSEQVFSSSKK